MNEQPIADAVFRNGQFIADGDDADVMRHADATTMLVDLARRSALPGLHIVSSRPGKFSALKTCMHGRIRHRSGLILAARRPRSHFGDLLISASGKVLSRSSNATGVP